MILKKSPVSKYMSEIEIKFLEIREPLAAAYQEVVKAAVEIDRKRKIVSLFAPTEDSDFLSAAQERYTAAMERLHTACIAYEILRTQVNNFYLENKEALYMYPDYETPCALDVVERAFIN